MGRINRDAIVAVFLLLICGMFFWASTWIEDMGYGTMGAEAWPRLILYVLTGLTMLYLFQSLRLPAEEKASGEGSRAG